jgi:hypothetical protein
MVNEQFYKLGLSTIMFVVTSYYYFTTAAAGTRGFLPLPGTALHSQNSDG